MAVGIRVAWMLGLGCAVVAVGCGDDSNASDSTPMAGSPAGAGSSASSGAGGAGAGGSKATGGSGGNATGMSGRSGAGSGGDAAGSAGTAGGSGGAAGSAGAGSGGTAAGSGGSGGTVAVPPGELEDAPIGWASVEGDGVDTTTGGGGGQTVRPTSAQQLMDYAESDDPLVIELEGTFSVPSLQVNSNKTLIGVGEGATIEGGIRVRGKADAFVSNVIIQNLRIHGATSDVDGDGMHIYYAHHVWVDHCEIWDSPDGNLDIVHASNWVTISWTKFRYTDDAPDRGPPLLQPDRPQRRQQDQADRTTTGTGSRSRSTTTTGPKA